MSLRSLHVTLVEFLALPARDVCHAHIIRVDGVVVKRHDDRPDPRSVRIWALRQGKR